MKEYYYGKLCDIDNTELETTGLLDIHTPYVTDNYNLALFNIHSQLLNFLNAKVDNSNTVVFQEQFKNAFKTLYQNQNGIIYHCEDNNNLVCTDKGVYFSKEQIKYNSFDRIVNVYEIIKDKIKNKEIIIIKYRKLKKEQKNIIINKIAKKISDNNFFKNDEYLQIFYKKHFKRAWKIATKNLQK